VELFPDKRSLASHDVAERARPRCDLMLSNSLTVTSIFGGMASPCFSIRPTGRFSACFHAGEYGGAQLTVADLFGFNTSAGRLNIFADRAWNAANLRLCDAVVGVLFGAVAP
jgi:hypothetical protein